MQRLSLGSALGPCWALSLALVGHFPWALVGPFPCWALSWARIGPLPWSLVEPFPWALPLGHCCLPLGPFFGFSLGLVLGPSFGPRLGPSLPMEMRHARSGATKFVAAKLT